MRSSFCRSTANFAVDLQKLDRILLDHLTLLVFVVQIDSTDTLKSLKYRVADQYGEPGRMLKMFLADKELKDEGKSLVELKLEDGTQLSVRKRGAEPPRKPGELMIKKEEKKPEEDE